MPNDLPDLDALRDAYLARLYELAAGGQEIFPAILSKGALSRSAVFEKGTNTYNGVALGAYNPKDHALAAREAGLLYLLQDDKSIIQRAALAAASTPKEVEEYFKKLMETWDPKRAREHGGITMGQSFNNPSHEDYVQAYSLLVEGAKAPVDDTFVYEFLLRNKRAHVANLAETLPNNPDVKLSKALLELYNFVTPYDKYRQERIYEYERQYPDKERTHKYYRDHPEKTHDENGRNETHQLMDDLGQLVPSSAGMPGIKTRHIG